METRSTDSERRPDDRPSVVEGSLSVPGALSDAAARRAAAAAEVLALSRALQAGARDLDPVHQRLSRRRRRFRAARRLVTWLVLLGLLAAVAILLPWADWWDGFQSGRRR